ncbi:hypothetical protein HDV01_000029 [Terramyces sp. JEL0728]|nr:hypothetical protein HDV01_000029 [Terramyces sp. JEL0728]
MSNPDTFLKIRQGVLQFVVLKPIVAIMIMVLKAIDKYDEGYIAIGSSYLWLSLAYNISVMLAMYCLVLFYLQCSLDLKQYRPMPKQGLLIAFFTWAGIITDGDIYSRNNIAQAFQDCLLCLEMPLFAWMHWYAFPWTDYDDSRLSSRLQIKYAIRDALGIRDIVLDTRKTFSFGSYGGIYLEDSDESLPFRTPGSPRRYVLNDDRVDIRFEMDEELEQQYSLARELTYGDPKFPVFVHENPAFHHPPLIQTKMNKSAEEFYAKVGNSEAQPSRSAQIEDHIDLWQSDEETENLIQNKSKGKGRQH